MPSVPALYDQTKRRHVFRLPKVRFPNQKTTYTRNKTCEVDIEYPTEALHGDAVLGITTQAIAQLIARNSMMIG